MFLGYFVLLSWFLSIIYKNPNCEHIVFFPLNSIFQNFLHFMILIFVSSYKFCWGFSTIVDFVCLLCAFTFLLWCWIMNLSTLLNWFVGELCQCQVNEWFSNIFMFNKALQWRHNQSWHPTLVCHLGCIHFGNAFVLGPCPTPKIFSSIH